MVEPVTENDFQYARRCPTCPPPPTEICTDTVTHRSPPPREILDAAGDLLRALAAPVRIAIVLQLHESQRCVHELVDALACRSRWSASI